MALTSNETAWAIMIITLGMTFVFMALFTYTSIKAQHAKSIEETYELITNIFVRRTPAVLSIVSVSLLTIEFTSNRPINRLDLLVIFISTLIIFTYLIQKAMSFVVIKIIKKQLELVKQLTDAIK